MEKQIEIEMDVQGVAGDMALKDEKADDSMLVAEEITPLKLEPLDRDSPQTSHNAYDTYFEVFKSELCDNSSEMKTLSENNVKVTIKQEPLQAAVSLSADCDPKLENDVGGGGAFATSVFTTSSIQLHNVLTPLTFDVPSFENSPTVSFGNLPSISSPKYVPTPMPSPLNKHINSQPPSVTNSYGAPNDSSNDECSAPPKKGAKKRLLRISEWSDEKRKFLKNIGKKYVTKRGKVVDDKILGPPCHCKFKCFEKISHAERYEIFQKFWCLGNKEMQWAFVVDYSHKQRKNRSLNREAPNNRQFTFKYFLPLILNSNENHSETINVCKTMFLNTLSVSGKIIKTAWNKYDGSYVEEDRRGRHANHNRVIKPDMVKSVCDHVRTFIPAQSHNIRKTSTKLYLDGSLSISRMFQLYKDWSDGSAYSSKAVTERQYRDIVNKNFNLGFFVPKKD